MEYYRNILQDKKKRKILLLHLKHKGRVFATNLFLTIIIIGISFIIISPILSLVSDVFKSYEDVYNPLIYLIPENYTMENITIAFEQLEYAKSLPFTLIFCVVIMIMQAFVSSFVGYGFARFKFKGSGILFGFVILTIVIPSQSIMIPLYMQFRYFWGGANLIDTYYPIVFMTMTGVGLRSGLYIFIFRQFYKGLPKEIEEAAFIDGAGPFRTYLTVMLPNAIPSLITVMLFSFVWQYNDIFFGGLFMKKMGLLANRISSLPPLLYQGLDLRDPNLVTLILNAGVFLTVVPLIIIYLFMQRYFMEGIERSGIVG